MADVASPLAPNAALARSPLDELSARVAEGHFGVNGSPMMPQSQSGGSLISAGLEEDDFFGGRAEDDNAFEPAGALLGGLEESMAFPSASMDANGYFPAPQSESNRNSLKSLPRLDTSGSIHSQMAALAGPSRGISTMPSKSSLYSAASGHQRVHSDATRHSSPGRPDFPNGDDLNGDSSSRSRSESANGSVAPPRERRSSFFDENNGHARAFSAADTESSWPDQNAWRKSAMSSGKPYSGSLWGGSQPDLSPAVPLLDQSHLKPGTSASLLSSEKTLELYRANVKKTNDPDVAYEFAVFLMDVARDKSFSPATSSASGNTSSTDARPTPVSAQSETSDYGRSGKITKRPAKDKAQDPLSANSSGPTSAVDESSRALANAPYMIEAVQILKRIADRGHVDAQALLGDTYARGIGTGKGKPDYDKAFSLFVLAGKHGHSHACYRVGQCCENGWGCRKDATKAVTWYNKAASAQYASAMYRLGIAGLNNELGLSKRQKEGFKWLKRAAELAHSQPEPATIQALHELALLHERGVEHVIFIDYEYAAELLAKASELGYAPSAYKLGECYEYGKMGCPQDSALSIHYYNIAAQQGHREACFALTAWYLVGSPGVLPQSDTEAYLWAKKAAEQGLAKAEYAVGYFTESGMGRHKDAREAMQWFRKAAEHGDKRAIARLKANAHQAAQMQREEAAYQARIRREAREREAAEQRRLQEMERAALQEKAAREARLARDRERAARAARAKREQMRKIPGVRSEEYYGQGGRRAAPGVAHNPLPPLPPVLPPLQPSPVLTSPSARNLTSPSSRNLTSVSMRSLPLPPGAGTGLPPGAGPGSPRSPSSNTSSPRSRTNSAVKAPAPSHLPSPADYHAAPRSALREATNAPPLSAGSTKDEQCSIM